MEAFDPAVFKTASRNQWNDSAAGWDAHSAMVREWLAVVTAAMLDVAGIGEGMRVLDVAAGAGDQTLDIAASVGPAGTVLATDFSPAILERAAANLARAGFSNVETLVADAEELDAGDAVFEAAISRLGLMFCPDPLAALRAMHRALKPGGRAATIVFSTPQANPCAALLFAEALKHAGLPPADPFRPGSLFSLGRPGLADELFARAGFVDVATTAVSAPFTLPSAARYLDFIRASASPVQQIVESLDAPGRQAAWAAMEQALRRFDHPGGWTGPNELLLTSGMRA